jgi:hypothetical protein
LERQLSPEQAAASAIHAGALVHPSVLIVRHEVDVDNQNSD